MYECRDFGAAEAIGVSAQVVSGGFFHAAGVAGPLQGDDAQVGGVFAARVSGVSAEKAREPRGCRDVVAAIERRHRGSEVERWSGLVACGAG